METQKDKFLYHFGTTFFVDKNLYKQKKIEGKKESQQQKNSFQAMHLFCAGVVMPLSHSSF